jgi:hypothetical protein
MQSCLAAIIIKRGIVDSDTCYSYVAAHCEGLGPDDPVGVSLCTAPTPLRSTKLMQRREDV